MGACCSAGRAQPERAPLYFYCPPVLDERMPLPFTHSSISTMSSGVLVDTNLDTSSPDTFRAPPPPLPYDALLDTLHGHGLESSATCETGKHSDGKANNGCVQSSLESDEKELTKLGDSVTSTIEEDACPICLEEYGKENPRILTKCEHHFHLSCILEWMERSDTCPICDQVVITLSSDFNTIHEEDPSLPPVELS